MGVELRADHTLLRCDRCNSTSVVGQDWMKGVIRLQWYVNDRDCDNYALCPKCNRAPLKRRLDQSRLAIWLMREGKG